MILGLYLVGLYLVGFGLGMLRLAIEEGPPIGSEEDAGEFLIELVKTIFWPITISCILGDLLFDYGKFTIRGIKYHWRKLWTKMN